MKVLAAIYPKTELLEFDRQGKKVMDLLEEANNNRKEENGQFYSVVNGEKVRCLYFLPNEEELSEFSDLKSDGILVDDRMASDVWFWDAKTNESYFVENSNNMLMHIKYTTEEGGLVFKGSVWSRPMLKLIDTLIRNRFHDETDGWKTKYGKKTIEAFYFLVDSDSQAKWGKAHCGYNAGNGLFTYCFFS